MLIEGSFLSLVQNAALLLALAFVFDLSLPKVNIGQVTVKQIPAGLLIAFIGVAIMLTPWVKQPGLVFDTRSILLSITGLFFGPIPTIVAVVATVAVRIVLGGVGMWMGIAVILGTSLIGLSWKYFRRNPVHPISWTELYLFGVVVHVFMLATTWFLPREMVLTTLSSIALPIMVVYPIGTMLLGLLMVNRRARIDIAARVREDAMFLRISEATAKLGHWVVDLRTNRMTWSDELWRIFGIEVPDDTSDPSELLQRSILADQGAAPIDNDRLMFMRPGELRVVRFRRRDGKIGHLQIVRGQDIRDVSSQRIQMVGVMQDVTDRVEAEEEVRRAQQETQRLLAESNASRRALLSMMEDQRIAESKLRESEERVRLAVTAANQGLFDLDIASDRAIVSPEYATMLGYDPTTFVETNTLWRERLHPDDRALTEQAYENYISGRSSIYRVEFRQKSATGEWKWILSQGSVTKRDENGKPLRMLGTHTDIHELKLMEQALRESEERYRLLVSTSPYAVAILQDGKIVYVNHAALVLLGAESEGHVLGRPMESIVHSDRRESAGRRLERLLSGEKGLYPVRDTFIRLDKSHVPVEVIAAPFVHQDRPAVQLIAVDISDRVRAEETIQRSNERLRDLAIRLENAREEERKQIARDIHDSLGQELTAIRMDLSLFASAATPQEVHKQVANTMSVTDRAIATVRRISRTLRPDVLDQLGFVDAMRWLATEFTAHSKLPCTVKAPDDHIVFPESMSIALFRTVQESLTNVARHAQATAVAIEFVRSEADVVLTIRDNGRGIRPEDQARRGSLGLVGMRERVRGLGGWCEVEPVPNGGTCVTVRVPMPPEVRRKETP